MLEALVLCCLSHAIHALRWHYGTPIPSNVQGLAVGVNTNRTKMYLFENAYPDEDNFMYEFDGKQFTKLDSSPIPGPIFIQDQGYTQIKDLIYMQSYDQIYIFNTTARNWTDYHLDIPINNNHEGASCFSNNKTHLFVIQLITNPQPYYPDLMNLQVYSIDDRQWINQTMFPNYQIPWSFISCAYWNQNIYIFGGTNFANYMHVYNTNLITKYDLSTNSWSELNTTLTVNNTSTRNVMTSDGIFYILGSGTAVNVFDANEEKVQNETGLLANITAGGAQMINNRIYYIGGDPYQNITQVSSIIV